MTCEIRVEAEADALGVVVILVVEVSPLAVALRVVNARWIHVNGADSDLTYEATKMEVTGDATTNQKFLLALAHCTCPY